MTRRLTPLVIVGAGGHGREALDIVAAVNAVEPTYHVLGFLDDDRQPGSLAALTEHEVLGGIGVLDDLDSAYVVAIGVTAARRKVAERLKDVARGPTTLVHPTATIGGNVRHGCGLIMAAGSRVTSAVTLGEHVHLNVNASVSHDCSIGSFVTVTPGAHLSGNVDVGDGVWFGIGAVATQGVRIAADVTVGAGAVVIDDLPAGCTAVGVPAKPLL